MNMTAALQKKLNENDIAGLMREMGSAARGAAAQLALASREAKDIALMTAAEELRRHTAEILDANARDIAAAEEAGRPASYVDRLMLDPGRIEGIAKGLEMIAGLLFGSWNT